MDISSLEKSFQSYYYYTFKKKKCCIKNTLDNTEDYVARENGDGYICSVVSCEDGSDESFLEHDTDS